MSEFWRYLLGHLPEVAEQTREHLLLTTISMVIASIIGITLGILIAQHKKITQPVLSFVGILQTVPSLALLGFLLPVFGIGKVPAIIALFLYALLPIVRNTYTGIIGVSPAAKEAAIGMGMNPWQLLRYVELPLAMPVILAGIKTSTVINVGIATLCAFIGAGGLGEFIFRGISLNNTHMILAGAIPASLLAIALDGALGLIQKNYHKKKLIYSLIIGYALILLSWIWYSNSSGANYKLTAGFNSEFIERADGFVGLDSLYDLPLRIREMEIGLMYKSLHTGEVDVIDGFSTDGRIEAYNLRLLEDDKGYFPPYYAAPVVHNHALRKYPSLTRVFTKFHNLISNKEMTQLNYLVDQQQQELAEVAYRFLTEKEMKANKDAGNHPAPDLLIGSKAFTENYLLAYMFAQAIEAQTGLTTGLKLGFGGTKLLFDALRTEEIALYPEYTGTGFLVILEPDSQTISELKKPQDVYDHVKKIFNDTYDISWMPPLGFNNSFALMMREQMADSLHIRSISDLSKFLKE